MKNTTLLPTFRSALTGLSIFFGFLFAAQMASAAAGNITVEQISNVGVQRLGTWELIAPGGQIIQSYRDEPVRSIDSAEPGHYVFSIQPPADAYPTIIIDEGGQTQNVLEGDVRHRFELTDITNLRIRVVYDHAHPEKYILAPRADSIRPEPQRMERPSDPIHITLNPNQSEVLPGGAVRYTLTATNSRRRTLEDLLVSIQFDPETSRIAHVQDYGVADGDLITWNIPVILAGQSWSTSFIVETNPELTAGDYITLAARGSRSGLVALGATDINLTSSVGIAVLPQTGESSDVLFVLLSVILGMGVFTGSSKLQLRNSK